MSKKPSPGTIRDSGFGICKISEYSNFYKYFANREHLETAGNRLKITM